MSRRPSRPVGAVPRTRGQEDRQWSRRPTELVILPGKLPSMALGHGERETGLLAAPGRALLLAFCVLIALPSARAHLRPDVCGLRRAVRPRPCPVRRRCKGCSRVFVSTNVQRLFCCSACGQRTRHGPSTVRTPERLATWENHEKARAEGAMFYESLVACPAGYLGQRYTSIGTCVACSQPGRLASSTCWRQPRAWGGLTDEAGARRTVAGAHAAGGRPGPGQVLGTADF